jgi:hypothetical protein
MPPDQIVTPPEIDWPTSHAGPCISGFLRATPWLLSVHAPCLGGALTSFNLGTFTLSALAVAHLGCTFLAGWGWSMRRLGLVDVAAPGDFWDWRRSWSMVMCAIIRAGRRGTPCPLFAACSLSLSFS